MRERSSILNCAHCQTPFKAFPKDIKRGRKYCSYACMGAAKRKHPDIPLYAERPCVICQTVFRAEWYAGKQRYTKCCSRACQSKLQSQRFSGTGNPIYKPKVPCICEHCGRSFMKYPSRVHERKGTTADFCSQHCMHVWNHARRSKRTDIEIKMAQLLTEASLAFREQVPMYERWIVDFVLDDWQLIVFCDGRYWHDRPKAVAKDRGQTAYLQKCGWAVLRFTDEQILRSADHCLNAIKQALNHRHS